VSPRVRQAPGLDEGDVALFRPPISRMAIAVLAVVGALVSGYLTLYKLGFLGTIQCGAGGCDTVQASQYSVLFGVPVAAWGVGAYVVILAVALLGLQPRWVGARWVSGLLVGLSAWGVAFSGFLTYLSGTVIGAFCQWCLVSATLITLIFLCSVVPLLRARRGRGRPTLPYPGP
jgi:uncharacterized membrane protein